MKSCLRSRSQISQKDEEKRCSLLPVKEAAIRHQIPVYQPVKVREKACVEVLKSYEADVIVVIAFGQILPQEILDMTPYGCVNVHASLLPKYRGAAPIQWAVINGDKVSGVTTMRMDEGLDTGDMIMKEEVVLDEKETGGSLFDRLSEVGADLCVRTLTAIENGTATYTKQDHEAATKTTLIKKQFGIIDWTKPAKEIECLIRGLNPWPSAYTYLHGKTLKNLGSICKRRNFGTCTGRIGSCDKTRSRCADRRRYPDAGRSTVRG